MSNLCMVTPLYARWVKMPTGSLLRACNIPNALHLIVPHNLEVPQYLTQAPAKPS